MSVTHKVTSSRERGQDRKTEKTTADEWEKEAAPAVYYYFNFTY